MKKSIILNELLMLFAAIFWGAAFVFQKKGMDYVGPFSFGTIRCLLGGFSLALVAIIIFLIKKIKKSSKSQYKWKDLIIGGLVLGSITSIATTFQQLGIKETTAGVSGFTTALYIVFVPIFGLIFFKKKSNILVILGILLALVGLYFTNVTEGKFQFNMGFVYLVLCAIVFSIQISLLDIFTKKCDAIQLTSLEFIVAGTLQLPLMLIFERNGLTLANIGNAMWPSILYAGLISIGICYTVQTFIQKKLNPTIASLIMSLESVFAVISGVIFLKETITPFQYLGFALIFAGVIISQIPIKAKK